MHDDAILKEFEGEIQFWPRECGWSVGRTRKQKSDTCWAFVAAACIRFLILESLGFDIPLAFAELSVKEIISRVSELYKMKGGSKKNFVVNGFNFSFSCGVYSSRHPLIKDADAVQVDGYKAFVGGFKEKRDRLISKEDHSKVYEWLLKRPLYGNIEVLEKRFYLWKPRDKKVYSESKAEKKRHRGNNVLDHSLLIVGRGISNDGIAYYIVQNNWGLDWGFGGYGRIAEDCFIEIGYPKNVVLGYVFGKFWPDYWRLVCQDVAEIKARAAERNKMTRELEREKRKAHQAELRNQAVRKSKRNKPN